MEYARDEPKKTLREDSLIGDNLKCFFEYALVMVELSLALVEYDLLCSFPRALASTSLAESHIGAEESIRRSGNIGAEYS